MRLIESSGLKVPAGAVVSLVDGGGGTALRAARWVPEGRQPAKGTVLICTGRSEFIEKYFDVVSDLLGRGFAAVVFDWRGQGLSTRALRNRRKGHVADFSEFGNDLDAVIAQVLVPFCPRPHFALAHSMGGTVMVHHAARPRGAFERIVLSAPMVEVHRLPRPLHHVAGGLARLGLGAFFVPQGQRAAVFDKGFANNLLTSDPDRFTAMMTFVATAPDLALGAPTVGWLSAALRAMRPLDDLAFCRAITTPILVIVPGADRVISVPAMERFAQRLKAGSMVRIPHARHEILMERDGLREQFWAAFDAFIPGGSSRASAPNKMDV